ncbi:MAG: dUTP diphosphatase [Sphingobacteriales bacterium]|nr:dUTP diphosphatase [Sphingobacteriales bacterium]
MSTKIINKSNNPLPHYATIGSAGMDVYAFLEQPIEIAPFERVLVPTGLYIELPLGYEAQLRARSGIALKKGLILPNAPATIDSDYRGEIKVILANISNQTQTVVSGERIAQMIVARHELVTWQVGDELSSTTRDSGGFGSTGI